MGRSPKAAPVTNQPSKLSRLKSSKMISAGTPAFEVGEADALLGVVATPFSLNTPATRSRSRSREREFGLGETSDDRLPGTLAAARAERRDVPGDR